MSSTNKTTNYELSQFVGSDKPTWLGDYNSDMGKIDTQMKTNANNVVNAQTTADTALSNATNAQTTADRAETTANTADTNASSALSKSLENETNISKFNLDVFETFTNQTMVLTNCNVSGNLKVASCTDGSVGKIYGVLNVTPSGNGDTVKIKVQTNLRPNSEIIINPVGFANPINSNITAKIQTNGELELSFFSGTVTSLSLMYLFPCIYFMKDFGDLPE